MRPQKYFNSLFRGYFCINYSVIQTRYTLKKHQRLKSKKLIGRLFKEGKSFSQFPVRLIYLYLQDEIPGVQAGFTVSTRHFKKATDRNRVKRLMREAYRLQKNELETQSKDSGKSLILFFVFTSSVLPSYELVTEKLKILIKKLENTISNS